MTRIPLRIQPMTGWSAAVNTAGLLGVGWVLWRVAPETAPWVVWLFGAGLVAWAVRMALAVRIGATGGDPAAQSGPGAAPDGRTAGRSRVPAGVAPALLVVMGLAGSLTAVPTQGLGTALLVVTVILLTSDAAVGPGTWITAAVLGALGVAAGALLTAAGYAGTVTASALGLLTILAALALAVVVGLGRRAQRVLLAERERANAEAVRAQATAHRVAIARDLHDVLAHSLGGLVIQLDAVDALLEAGDTGAARERVVAARGLAAGGLSEARRAVAALREPADGGAAVEPAAFRAAIDDLVSAHRSLGGEAALAVSGRPRTLTAAQATALQRALQEALSNARKHAPGRPVRARLQWQDERVLLTVSTPLGDAPHAALAASGGGHGIEGMRERFAALPLGGSATAGVVGGDFTVTAEARLA